MHRSTWIIPNGLCVLFWFRLVFIWFGLGFFAAIVVACCCYCGDGSGVYVCVWERGNIKFGGYGDEKNLGGADEGKGYDQNVLYEKQLRNRGTLALQALKDSNCHPRLLLSAKLSLIIERE